MLKIAVFTLIEDIALALWLSLVRSGQRVGGAVILFVGLVFEHLFSYNVGRRGVLSTRVDEPPVRRNIITFSAIETVVWVVWLVLAGTNAVLAFVFLLAGLIVEHSITDNVAKGRGLFERLVDVRTIPFSIVETVGATAWLQIVNAGDPIKGFVVLFIFQLIEHFMAIDLARQPS